MLAIKAIVYRVLRIILLILVAYIVTGDISTATEISAIDAIVATLYYYFFDKFWDRFKESLRKSKL